VEDVVDGTGEADDFFIGPKALQADSTVKIETLLEED